MIAALPTSSLVDWAGDARRIIGNHARAPGPRLHSIEGMASITVNEVQGMVNHWLNTPVCGYLGSDYGQDGRAMLQLAQSDQVAADAFLKKLIVDLPILQAVPRESINLYGVQSEPDRMDLVLDVAGLTIQLQ